MSIMQRFKDPGEKSLCKRQDVSPYPKTIFPNKPFFFRVCSTSLLKTLCEKEKLLVTSNFSFSHRVFYLFGELCWLVMSVYLSSLATAHLNDTQRRRLVVTVDSARIHDETTENSAWFFNVFGVYQRHTGPRFNVSSEILLAILVGQQGI